MSSTMKLVILSDIHSHSKALEHIVNIYKEDGDVRFCVLGDVIGYGSDPVGCLRILKDLDEQGKIFYWQDDSNSEKRRIAIIGGNHEEAWLWCENREYREYLNQLDNLSKDQRLTAIFELAGKHIYPDYKRTHERDMYEMSLNALVPLLLNMYLMQKDTDPAIEWYRSIILENLYGPLVIPHVNNGKWSLILAHGTCDAPRYGELLPCGQGNLDNIKRYIRKQIHKEGEQIILLHGHTHIPLYFNAVSMSLVDLIYNEPIFQNVGAAIINPGSVGLPRDQDRRPSAVSLEFDEVGFKTIFLREKDLHAPYVKDLGNEGYPDQIKKWVSSAPTKLAEECYPLLKKRAGQHYIDQ